MASMELPPPDPDSMDRYFTEERRQQWFSESFEVKVLGALVRCDGCAALIPAEDVSMIAHWRFHVALLRRRTDA